MYSINLYLRVIQEFWIPNILSFMANDRILLPTKEHYIMTLLVLRFNWINKSRNFSESVTYLVSRQVFTSCLNQFCKPVLFLPQWVVTKDGATVVIKFMIVIYTNITNINLISLSGVSIFILHFFLNINFRKWATLYIP